MVNYKEANITLSNQENNRICIINLFHLLHFKIQHYIKIDIDIQ